MIWHIRPYSDSITYGTQDGRSFENAFNGLAKIHGPTGPTGIGEGDTVMVYGRHVNIENHNRKLSIKHGMTIIGVGCWLENQWIVGSTVGASGVTVDDMHGEGLSIVGDTSLPQDQRPQSWNVVNCTFSKNTGIRLNEGMDYWTIRNCRFVGCSNGVYFLNRNQQNVTEGGSARHATIEGCIFEDMGKDWTYGDGHAIGIQAATDLVIRNNRMINGRGSAITCWLGSTGVQHRIRIEDNWIDGTIDDGRNSLFRGIGFSPGNNNVEGRRKGCVVSGNRIRNTAGDGIGWNCPDQGVITGNEVLNAGRHSFFEYQPGVKPVIPNGNTFLESSQAPISIRYGPNFDQTAEAPDNIIG